VPQYNALQVDRASYRGGVRGRGGFGRGIVPAVCHNYQKIGNYAREYPIPPVTCMYSRASDHDTEDFPTLLGKIQDKRNKKIQNGQCCKSEGWWKKYQHSYA